MDYTTEYTTEYYTYTTLSRRVQTLLVVLNSAIRIFEQMNINIVPSGYEPFRRRVRARPGRLKVVGPSPM
jgi:hypothetical protein